LSTKKDDMPRDAVPDKPRKPEPWRRCCAKRRAPGARRGAGNAMKASQEAQTEAGASADKSAAARPRGECRRCKRAAASTHMLFCASNAKMFVVPITWQKTVFDNRCALRTQRQQKRKTDEPR